ncbi:MAG: hypothetical protein SO401_10885 [Blautia sp.]|nr:hypothetical protein [Clostridia bacterium]MDY4694024.1 hypothetical protein [Blautia sp.]MDY5554842.1 hypothetical protein [Blautia sp.]
MQYIQEQDATKDLENYMACRMKFFSQCPKEAHIFFEALLNPPVHLSEDIGKAFAEFNDLNEKMYKETLDSLILRDGISKEEAVSYFHLMQLMLNGYFSSPAFQNMELQKKIELHEMIVPRLLDCMLYGIAKGKFSFSAVIFPLFLAFLCWLLLSMNLLQ